MSIEKMDKRFGEVAIEKGFIDPEQLMASLKIQAGEEREQGKHRIIGAILVEYGFMNISQVEEVIHSMDRSER